MNLYTGGSLMMRAPGRNYPLVNAQLPSLRAGCGGIDLYGGAFSFINKQQFIALLQNIGSNAVGYAFKLALQSISPDIDKLLTELQDQMNKINAMNINSCEAAQALVNGVVGEYDSSVQSGCANISQYLGSVTDRADARSPAPPTPRGGQDAANSADPNVRNATFVKGNVIWLALNQVGGTISQQEKELIMSVIGTVILYPPADDGSGASRAMPSPPSPACAICCSAAAPPPRKATSISRSTSATNPPSASTRCAPPSPSNPSRNW
jgi:conjugative transfer pilus assembly protein TraH